jgi:hypothetical protein
MTLKSLSPVLALASSDVFIGVGRGQSASACGLGKLLDVQGATEYVPTVQVGRVHRNGSKDWTNVELPSTRKQTIYTVKMALNGIIYTARSSGDFWGYKPANMIVGAELEACVHANKLLIARPGGKQYKPTITRREHDQPAGTERRQEPLP